MKAVYLDNAATSFPKPERVYTEADRCLREYCANPGRSGHKMAMKCAELIYKTRERTAHFFNIKNPLRICFTKNATEALNFAIKGYVNKGGHIVTTAMEHNSVFRPLENLRKDGICEYSIAEADFRGEVAPEEINKRIKSNTCLVVCTLSSNVNGVILPVYEIAELCRKKGIVFLLDASQGAGSIELDVEAIKPQMMAAPGHKGLLGPQGTGLLYVEEGLTLRSLEQGGTGSSSLKIDQPAMLPDNQESGTLNTPGIAGLCAGLEFIESVGIVNISKHKQKLNEALHEGLSRIKNIKLYSSPLNNSGIAALNIGDTDSTQVGTLLDDEYDIASRASFHCAPLAHKTFGTLKQGIVRLSPGYFNTIDEIEYTVRSLFEISEKL